MEPTTASPDPSYKRFHATPAKPKLVGDRTLRFCITSSSVDSYGDIVAAEGLNVERYLKTPVVLWSHDPTLPIGQAVDLYYDADGKRWMADLKFRTTPLAEEVFQAYLSGDLTGVSIGFRPLTDPERMMSQAQGYSDSQSQGYNYRRSELLEISAVAIPANSDALGVRTFSAQSNYCWRQTFALLDRIESHGGRAPVLRAWAASTRDQAAARRQEQLSVTTRTAGGGTLHTTPMDFVRGIGSGRIKLVEPRVASRKGQTVTLPSRFVPEKKQMVSLPARWFDKK